MGYGDLYLRSGSRPGATAGATGAAAAPLRSLPSQPTQPARTPRTPQITVPPVALPMAPDTEAAARVAELAALAGVAAGCTRCRLAEGRNQVVFGSGDPNAGLMFIGEGPGAEEDRQGLPFVGAAGGLLTRMIQAMEMTRDEVYIANVVKCRPPGNRDPQPDETAACRGYLEKQIALVRPRVIVALGRVAAQTLLGNDSPIGRMRGQWFQVQGIPTMVTYHPAALLRNQALKRPTWEDLQQVRDLLRAGSL
jgi:uracil-DNA glycosylase family 4